MCSTHNASFHNRTRGSALSWFEEDDVDHVLWPGSDHVSTSSVSVSVSVCGEVVSVLSTDCGVKEKWV